MLALVEESAKNKSQPERAADRFAGAFLPIVLAIGLVTFIVTRNPIMTASIFLVACADDMAVAIPLAVTAALGGAARRGIVVKGGEWLEILARLRTVVLDKTGTVTYGALSVEKTEIAPGVEEGYFWKTVASAEKFSDHPMGRAVYRLAASKLDSVADPEKYEAIVGAGVAARVDGEAVAIGSAKYFDARKLPRPAGDGDGHSSVFVASAGRYLGRLAISDLPRPEAAQALWRLKEQGIKKIVMFTGDRSETAARIAAALGIDEFRAEMKPEDKVREIEKLLGRGPVAMVGDGINDAPALARSDVGIAMGGGAAAAIEAADVVILADDLNRLPQAVELSRRAMGVIRSDIIIWAVSNLFGFALVLTGFAGPVLASFYNFATDFFPLINSSRLFKIIRK
jgi:heavy metal translocating P-type ATPase